MSDKKQERDAFDSYQEVCSNAIDEFARLQAQYVQSFTNLQQEVHDTARTVTESGISVAKQVTNATWGPNKAYIPTVKAASEVTDAFLKAAEVNSKVIIAGLDATRQNVKIFNSNIQAFTRLNLDLIKTWASFVPFRA